MAELVTDTVPFFSVVIPAYNEERKIYADLETVCEYFDRAAHAYEVIVVDDGSTDNTSEEIKRFQLARRAVKLIAYAPNRGKGSAVKTGMLQARGQFVLFADAGSCVPYREIEKGLKLLRDGYDIAIGSRGLEESQIGEKQALYRQVGSRLFGLIVHYGMGLRDISDTQCGFKLFKHEVARELFGIQRVDGFMFDIETLINARRLGYRVSEFPVVWSNDPDTRFRPVSGSLRNFKELFRIVRNDHKSLMMVCVLCGESNVIGWRIVEGRSIVACRTCGLVFVHPQPTAEERESQYLANRTSPIQYYAATASVDWETFNRRLAIIERYVPSGKLLDVGCSVGTFMGVATERGWKAVGLEPNPVALRYARDAGLAVVGGFLCAETLDGLGREFDLVNMADVIEHFADPCEAVRVAVCGLRRGGLLSVSTPDFRSLIARRFQIKPLEHLFYFTEGTLSRLLKQSGLQVEAVMHTTRRRDLRHVLLGTTALAPSLRFLARGAVALGLADFLSRVAERVVRDELWVLARRP